MDLLILLLCFLLADAHYDLMTALDTPLALPPPFTMAAADWLPLWRLPLLLSTLTSCFLSASAETTPFPRDLEPISVYGLNGKFVRLRVHTDGWPKHACCYCRWMFCCCVLAVRLMCL